MGFWPGIKDFLLGAPRGGSIEDITIQEVDYVPGDPKALGCYDQEDGIIYIKRDQPEEKKQRTIRHELAHIEHQQYYPHSSPEDLAAEEIDVTLDTHGHLSSKRLNNIIRHIMEQFDLDRETSEEVLYRGASRVLDERDMCNLADYLGLD